MYIEKCVPDVIGGNIDQSLPDKFGQAGWKKLRRQ